MTSQLPCTSLYEKFGILRSELEHVTSQEFSIPMDFLNCYDKYFLLYWSAEYLLENLEGSKGLLNKDDTQYTWHLLHGMSLGKIATLNPLTQFALSFRKPKAEFGIHPKVLISLTSRP